MKRTPAEIIRASRELEGVPVDLGSDRPLSHSQRLGLLAALARDISRAEPGSLEQAHLVDRYNTNLYIALTKLEFDQQTLPTESCIPADLMLIGYVELEKYLDANGPWTLALKWATAAD